MADSPLSYSTAVGLVNQFPLAGVRQQEVAGGELHVSPLSFGLPVVFLLYHIVVAFILLSVAKLRVNCPKLYFQIGQKCFQIGHFAFFQPINIGHGKPVKYCKLVFYK